MTDPVSPAHYKGDIECIDALRAALTPEEFQGYVKGSAMAYLWRLGKRTHQSRRPKKHSGTSLG